MERQLSALCGPIVIRDGGSGVGCKRRGGLGGIEIEAVVAAVFAC
jgi:hypothetical protein